MTPTVTIRRNADGSWTLAPEGAPSALDSEPDIDVAVLEVAGGLLSWSVLGGQTIPAAVVDDLTLAQDWIWAVYGERIAVALDDFDGAAAELPVEPALPELAAAAWRLGYALWASRWWPASTIDGIAALDDRLLDEEIAALVEECDLIVSGADAIAPQQLAERPIRADDYALAAGEVSGAVLVLERGTGGWDWRRCPPGLVDASERAVSWELIRSAGTTTVKVRVVAAPSAPVTVPAHLIPRAAVGTVEVELNRAGDSWTGEAVVLSALSGVTVDVYVPGIGVAAPRADAHEVRQRVRDFAAARLRRALVDDTAAVDRPLLAEIAAATSDSDF